MQAEGSCIACPTYGDLLNYINAKEADGKPAVYWDNGDEGTGLQTYKAFNEDGILTEFHTGLWLMKKAVIGNAWKDNITPESHVGYEKSAVPQAVTEAIRTGGKYFFLPAAGGYVDGDINNGGNSGSYWSSTPESNNADCAYGLNFNINYVIVNSYYREFGFVPLRFE